jgi:hypothetical protein
MEFIGQGVTALGAAALACLLATGATAEENLGWHGDANADGASLFYGIPQSDHAPVSFSCTPDGNGLTFVFVFIPNDPIDSAEVEVLLQAGDIEVPIRTTGMYTGDVRSRLFILEGKTVLDDRLTDLITSEGTLSVFVEKEKEEYPLDGAREAAAPLLKTCAGQALDTRAANPTICRMRAWSTDTDPDGQNVRAGPGTQYAVIGRLPPPQDIGGESFATEVSIIGSQDGWFRIDAATINNYIVDDGPNTVFEGEGWVSGGLLGLSVEGSYLFREPSRHAALTLDLRENPELRQGRDYLGPRLERLHACMGEWAEVEVMDLGKRVRGWTDDICSSQVTTCP